MTAGIQDEDTEMEFTAFFDSFNPDFHKAAPDFVAAWQGATVHKEMQAGLPSAASVRKPLQLRKSPAQ